MEGIRNRAAKHRVSGVKGCIKGEITEYTTHATHAKLAALT